VVVGEIGSVKKEIALLGDTLNTAAGLVDVYRNRGESVIASADLLDRLVLPPAVAARSLGQVRLRGKEQPLSANQNRGLVAIVRSRNRPTIVVIQVV
jgi:adenylate cyclase